MNEQMNIPNKHLYFIHIHFNQHQTKEINRIGGIEKKYEEKEELKIDFVWRARGLLVHLVD